MVNKINTEEKTKAVIQHIWINQTKHEFSLLAMHATSTAKTSNLSWHTPYMLWTIYKYYVLVI